MKYWISNVDLRNTFTILKSFQFSICYINFEICFFIPHKMNTKNSITDIKTEILIKQNWNWNTCQIEIETEIHCKTIIETELKYIANRVIPCEINQSLPLRTLDFTEILTVYCTMFHWIKYQILSIYSQNCESYDHLKTWW